MFRWFRLLVIAVLLPCYGLAAVATPAVPQPPAQASEVAPASAPAADFSALLAELGDTTDDIAEHCTVHALALGAPPPPAAPACLGHAPAVDAPQARPLRPPCVRG